MHKLERPTEPIELIHARRAYTGTYPQDKAWKKFGKNGDRTKVREQLEAIQNDLCAYCENSLENSGHIDHFKPKSLDWKVTFKWDNLVVSCTHKDSCGSKKAKNYEDYWINPYLTDPAGMFKFYSDGQIEGATQEAQKVIEDFGLDSPRLEKKREGILTILKQTILALESQPEALEYFLQEDAEIFPTAYKQIIDKISGE